MKNIFISIIVGAVVGVLVFSGLKSYNDLNMRVGGIEQFLIQAQKQAQQRPPMQEPAKG